uniref:G-protein coupled receptors family 1 profile domain-containing protein n=1 Tax=Romanomermis culicivorax TaxID=13658 RepID=A0A915KTC2_ROMCU
MHGQNFLSGKSKENLRKSPVSADHDCGLRIHRGKYTPSKRNSALTASFGAADDTRSTCSLSTTMSSGGGTGARCLAINGPAPTPRQSGISLKDSLVKTNFQAAEVGVGNAGSRASSPDKKFRGQNFLTSPTALVDDQAVATGVTVTGSFSRAKDNRARYYRRLHNEIKAVKTVGLVTLCFVCCWFGFSIVYTLQAFCGQQGGPQTKDCVPGAMFTLFFWLGYVNSALNPLIYAAYNRHRILSGAAFGRKKRRYGGASPSSNLEYVASKAANARMGRSESRGPMCKTPDISISN